MSIGLKIKELMSQEKIDVPTLAKQIGKTKQAVYDMLGKDDLNTSILRQLSVVFNVPISYFFEEKECVTGDQEEIKLLRQEVLELNKEVQRLNELKLPQKDDRLYDLWGQFMRNQAQYQEIMEKMAAIYCSKSM